MLDFIPYEYREIVYWVIRLIMLGVLVYAMMEVLDYVTKFRLLQRAARDAFNQMSLRDKQRSIAAKKAREISGEGEVKGFINRIDHDLMYSGLKIKYKWLQSEMYITIQAIAYLQIFLVVQTIARNMLAGLAIVAILAVLQKVVIQTLSHLQYSRTEATLLQFMNIIENFAMQSDDLINILDRSSYYLDEPIKSQIVHAVIEARNTGDSMTALKNLQDGIQHQFFKQFIRNLEVCSRYDTNYKDIIQDSRHVLEVELKNEKERQAIYANGRAEILAMLLCGVACIFLMGGITGGGNTIEALLNGGIFGTIILIFCIVTIIISLYFAFIANMRHH